MDEQAQDHYSGNDFSATDQQGNQTNHGRTSFSAGSTTQGGFNHGQGSHDIGGSPYRQGSEKTSGHDIEPLNGSGPVGDAVDTGTRFDGAVDATVGAGEVGDSYGSQGIAGNNADASTNASGQQPVNLQDNSHRNADRNEHTAEGGKDVNQQSDRT